MSHTLPGGCLPRDRPLTEEPIALTSPTARIPLDHPNTALSRAVSWWSRRTYGEVLEPGLVLLDAGIPVEKLEAVPSWREADVFTDLECRAMEYAEAMSVTPLEVTDAMVAGLRERLTDAALVELTVMVALENSRSRTNAAFGLTSQGFADHCELRPVAAASTGGGTAHRDASQRVG